jgi:molybdopterin synthase catalytic subunit/molybdopterin converting factor small subunit
MRVRILPFGVLKDWLGSSATTLELPEGACVADVLDRLSQLHTAAPALRGIAVSVNAEYATADHLLEEGDEVGLLPPVSGGIAPRADDTDKDHGAPMFVSLTQNVIETEKLVAAAKSGEDGAVVVFDGIVRDNTRGRRTLFLDYEAYEEMALKQMNALAEQALVKFPVRHVTIVHRLGHLDIGESSVLIVVASAHRGAAFEACRWIIDTLKQTVPIWKKETFADGAVWAAGEPFPIDLAVEPEAASHDRPGNDRGGKP